MAEPALKQVFGAESAHGIVVDHTLMKPSIVCRVTGAQMPGMPY